MTLKREYDPFERTTSTSDKSKITMAPSKPLGGGIDDPTRNETERYMLRLLKIRNKSQHFFALRKLANLLK